MRGIGEEAFLGCSGLTEIALPKQVISVFTGAFQKCINVKNVTVSSPNTVISSRVFQGITGKVFLSAKNTKNLTSIFWFWKDNPKKISVVTWKKGISNIEVMENTFEYSRIHSLVVPSATKKFTMWQQEMMLCDYLVVPGKDTIVSKDTIMGDDPNSYYVNAKAIVLRKGSKLEKYARKFKRPCIETIHLSEEADKPTLEEGEHYTEKNVGMKRVKIIVVEAPKKIKATTEAHLLKWKPQKRDLKYQIFYSKKKGGKYSKIATTKSGLYEVKKKGYYKIRGVKKLYDAEWKGAMSDVVGFR